jgi:2,3-bisphosphoglycerate-independent phosphoglycerate mutase
LLKLIDHLDIIDNQVCIHAITDGRDTAPQSCRIYLDRLQQHLKGHKSASIGTVIGRYYAMDRDKRWERTEIAYNAMTQGIGEQSTAQQLDAIVSQRYAQKENDEFLKPIVANTSALIKGNNNSCL